MNLYAEICMVTTALFDAHAQAVRDETDARNDYARGMAAGQRVQPRAETGVASDG
jgi:hypothetical protein